MSIEVACAGCGKSYRVEDRLAGKRGKCKQCGTTITIPPLVSIAAPPAGDERPRQAVSPLAQGSPRGGGPPRAEPQPKANQIACVQCGSRNPAGTAFCTACGRALPGQIPSGPRVVSGLEAPTTELGRGVLSDQLTREMSKACWALLAVAMIQAILGPWQISTQVNELKRTHPGMIYHIKPVAYLTIFGIATAYWVLFAWALRNPLPAAIVGLVIYITLWVVDVIADPTALAKGWLVKVLVIGALGQAIAAGVRFRKLGHAPPAQGSLGGV